MRHLTSISMGLKGGTAFFLRTLPRT